MSFSGKKTRYAVINDVLKELVIRFECFDCSLPIRYVANLIQCSFEEQVFFSDNTGVPRIC